MSNSDEPMGRLHSTAPPEFFSRYVYRYHDKQYQTWLGGHFTHVGIDYSYQKELQDRIFAGIANHFMDYSYSNALKLVVDKPRENRIPSFERTFDKVEYRFFITTNHFLRRNRSEINLKHEHDGIVHAELFLLRLLTSFKAARYLINWGFFSEPLTILRSSLEQLAWCYAVGHAFEKRQLENPRPSKCISIFRDRFKPAGQLYGALSRFSHMEFEAQKHFVVGGQKQSGVMQQSTEFKFFGLLLYSFLLIATQYVCRDFAEFYRNNYGVKIRLYNIVLPLRLLVSHALLSPELDKDEIAATLSEIYFSLFSHHSSSNSRHGEET